MEKVNEYAEINAAFRLIAKEIAVANGFIRLEVRHIKARETGFWGYLLSPDAVVTSTDWIYPEFEEDKEARQQSWHKEKGILPKSDCRVDIDMYWGKPRLNVRLKGGTCAFVTCASDGTIREAQAFGDAGPMLLMHIKTRIDELMERETKINYNEINT